MENFLLFILVVLLIGALVTGCGSEIIEVERDYELYQLDKQSQEVINERLFGFLVFVTAGSESSREQRLNFYYKLDSGEIKEKTLDGINIDKISYIFIERGEKPKVEVLFKSPPLRNEALQEYKKSVELYREDSGDISQITFHIPEGTIAKYYKVE